MLHKKAQVIPNYNYSWTSHNSNSKKNYHKCIIFTDDGWTEAKIENFGQYFVDYIKEYCEKYPPPDSKELEVDRTLLESSSKDIEISTASENKQLESHSKESVGSGESISCNREPNNTELRLHTEMLKVVNRESELGRNEAGNESKEDQILPTCEPNKHNLETETEKTSQGTATSSSPTPLDMLCNLLFESLEDEDWSTESQSKDQVKNESPNKKMKVDDTRLSVKPKAEDTGPTSKPAKKKNKKEWSWD